MRGVAAGLSGADRQAARDGGGSVCGEAGMRTAQVRITSNEEQFLACPTRQLRTGLRAFEIWKNNHGRVITVLLPAVKHEETCTGWCWRVLPSDTEIVRPDFGPKESWVCEHEIEAD